MTTQPQPQQGQPPRQPVGNQQPNKDKSPVVKQVFRGVRLSYPQLGEPKRFMKNGNPQGEPYYSTSFWLPKSPENDKLVEQVKGRCLHLYLHMSKNKQKAQADIKSGGVNIPIYLSPQQSRAEVAQPRRHQRNELPQRRGL